MFEAKTGDGQCQNCPFKPDKNNFGNSVHYFVFLCVRVVDAHDEGVVNDLGSVNGDKDNNDDDDQDDEDYEDDEDQDYKPVFQLMHILPPKSKPLPELLKII